MTVSLRPFARSRCLRAMSVLAWLMLVATSLAAATRYEGDSHNDPSRATTAVAVAYGHRAVVAMTHGSAAAAHSCCDEHGGGCGDPSNPACGCAAMGASVLPSGVVAIAALPLAMAYAWPVRVSTPTTDLTPPLRPPLV